MWYKEEDEFSLKTDNEFQPKIAKRNSVQLKRVDSMAAMSEGEYKEMEEFYDKLDKTVSGNIKKEDLLKYIQNLEGNTGQEWEPGEFEAFINFHIESIGGDEDEHIDKQKFMMILRTLKDYQNKDFLMSRIFGTNNDEDSRNSYKETRKKISYLKFKRGEIVFQQEQVISDIWIVYHGKAQLYRETENKKIQSVIQLNSGQTYGISEMILGTNKALLSMKISDTTTMVKIPLDCFSDLLKKEPELLWNLTANTLTQVNRIEKFMKAAPFLISDKVEEENKEKDKEDSQINENSNLIDIVKKVFGPEIEEKELKYFKRIKVDAGEYIYKRGDESKHLWLLLKGELSEDFSKTTISCVDGVKILGEIDLLTSQDRTKDLVTKTSCELIQISKLSLKKLSAKNSTLIHLVKPILIKGMVILNSIDIAYEYKVVRHGEILFRPGEKSTSLFLLVNGRIRLESYTSDLENLVSMTDISKSGEIIGEISMLTDRPHSHLARVVRDSELVVFSNEGFDNAISNRPDVIYNIIKTIQNREKENEKGTQKKNSKMKMICVLPAHHDPMGGEDLIREFSNRLVEELGQIGSTRVIRSKTIEDRFPKVTKTEDLIGTRKIWYYIHSQEENYDFVVCVADPNPASIWTKWILKQVDSIFIVADFDKSPELTLEKELEIYTNKYLANKHLVLIHNQNNITGTSKWLEKRKINTAHHHHIKLRRKKDYQRLARIIGGCSVGLVLGGGFAKGVAHLGVIKALYEFGIPIDYVGGSSIGGQVASFLAMNHNLKTMTEIINSLYYKTASLDVISDITFPFLSILSGKVFKNKLVSVFEDKQIEDLWIPFFCVSTNLGSYKQYIHDSGDLWFANRASSSVPLIVPPVVTKQGLLVDGSFINNVPTDVMNQMGANILIGVDVGSKFTFDKMNYNDEISGFKILIDKVARKDREYITLYNFFFQLTFLIEAQKRDKRKNVVDVNICPDTGNFGNLDFHPFKQHQLFNIGYSAAINSLEKLKNKKPHLWKLIANQREYPNSCFESPTFMKDENRWKEISLVLTLILLLIVTRRYDLLHRIKEAVTNFFVFLARKVTEKFL